MVKRGEREQYMCRSNDLIDESSRLKHFSWEQWDDHFIAVIFRPGHHGLDRYVVKRYVEQVLQASPRWKQLSYFFSKMTPVVRAYVLSSYEIELMQRILDYHLGNKLRLRLTQSVDQLIEYEQFLDFVLHAQELLHKNYNPSTFQLIDDKISSIPTISSSYTLPSLTKSLLPSSIINCHSVDHSSKSHLPISQSNTGWIQINNAYLPFILRNQQRLVPYQILVSCKILEPNELRSNLIRSTSSDICLINKMIRDCKVNNEQIPENTSLINVHHVLIGTKNLIYAKILPRTNPTSKINHQYKTILALQGGLITQTLHPIPFINSNNRAYIPIKDLSNIYPNLYHQFQQYARIPRSNEFEYLQLIHMYLNEKELALDTLLIDIDYLHQKQIFFFKASFLNEYHLKEKSKFEQQNRLFHNSITNKRKSSELQSPKRLEITR